jgi:hypothetical protein
MLILALANLPDDNDDVVVVNDGEENVYEDEDAREANEALESAYALCAFAEGTL